VPHGRGGGCPPRRSHGHLPAHLPVTRHLASAQTWGGHFPTRPHPRKWRYRGRRPSRSSPTGLTVPSRTCPQVPSQPTPPGSPSLPSAATCCAPPEPWPASPAPKPAGATLRRSCWHTRTLQDLSRPFHRRRDGVTFRSPYRTLARPKPMSRLTAVENRRRSIPMPRLLGERCEYRRA